MWETKSLRFEVAVVRTTATLCYIFLGDFEERTPRARKFLMCLYVFYYDHRKWDKDIDEDKTE